MPDGNIAAEGRSPEEIMREQVAARVKEEQSTDPAPALEQNSWAPRKFEDVPTDFIVRCLDANELGDGVLYAHLFSGRHAYVGQADEWIFYTGHHWHVDLVEKAHAASVDVEKVAQLYERTAALYRRRPLRLATVATKRRLPAVIAKPIPSKPAHTNCARSRAACGA